MRELTVLQGHEAGITGCAVSGDSSFLVSASLDGTLKLWDAEAGLERATLVGHAGPVTACAASPVGEFVVSASRDGTLKLWDPRSGQELRTFEGHADSAEACSVSSDGSLCVSAGWDGTVKLWDVTSGENRATLAGHSGPVHACAISPRGDLVVSASSDGTLRLWDAASGHEQTVLVGHNSAVWACAVDPGGRFVVSGGQDGTVRVWDPASGRELATFRGHVGGVHGCTVSPDGERVVSAGQDGTLRVWDVATGRELATLEGHVGPVWDCAISPDETFIVSAGQDETLRMWDLGRVTPQVQADEELAAAEMYRPPVAKPAELKLERLTALTQREPQPGSILAELLEEAARERQKSAVDMLTRAARSGALRRARAEERRALSEEPPPAAAAAQPSAPDLRGHLRVLQAVVERGDRVAEAGVLSAIGAVYARSGQLSKARDHHERALRIFRELGARELEAATVHVLATLHHDLGDDERALAYGHEALELSRRVSSREGEAAALAHLGALYTDVGRLDEALALFESAVSLNRELGDSLAAAASLDNMTAVLGRIGRHDEAASRRAEAEWIRSAQGAAAGDLRSDLDPVDCTVFAPPRVRQGDELLVQVFAHTWEQTEAAVALAQEFDIEAERRGLTTLEVEIAPGTTLTFHLAMPGLVVPEDVQSLVWRRRPASVQFAMRVPEDHRLGTATGKVTVCADNVPRGYVTFKLEVVGEDASADLDPAPVAHDAHHHRLAFISYASPENLDAALHCVQVLRAAGIEPFQDILAIEPGERWELNLVEHIGECDLFLLVWSSAAKESGWVEKEFDMAMARKEGDDLAPPTIGLYVLEDGVEPWPKYSGMHFRDPVFYMRRGLAGTT